MHLGAAKSCMRPGEICPHADMGSGPVVAIYVANLDKNTKNTGGNNVIFVEINLLKRKMYLF